MDDKLNNNQNKPVEPVNNDQVNICPECKKNPCVCNSKNNNPKFDVNQPRTEPPKISWI
jgi:hypothetical protein